MEKKSPMTNAERQKLYRERRKNDKKNNEGNYPAVFNLPHISHVRLAALAASAGCSPLEAIEALIDGSFWDLPKND